jgi:hypothetical protein
LKPKPAALEAEKRSRTWFVTSTKRQARAAGAWYLLLALTAPFGLVYVPAKLIVDGNASATSDNIRALEPLLRFGIASELIHQVVCIFLVLALYRLFQRTNEQLAAQLVILGALVSVPIVFVNVLNDIAALIFARGPEYLTAFDKPQRDGLAYLFMHLHGQGIQVAAIFWGLWLFPFGMLAIRSGFVPWAVGALLLVAGIAYLATSFTALVVPRYESLVAPRALPFKMGELPMVVWLLVWGAREPTGRASTT